MKKRMMGLAIALPAAALLGGTLWYLLQMQRTNHDLNETIARMQASKLVDVEFVISPPTDTPKDQPIYLSGSIPALGNWDSAGLPLERKEDGKWHATAQVLSGIDYGYKITRGTWGTVESDEKGTAISDRSLKVPAAQAVDVQVAEWVDHGQTVPGRVTTSGEVRLLKKFKSKILNNDRTIAVYLPPGYDANQDQHYPVLYMQDGQNLFDESTSFAGIEWKLDEAAQKLIGSGETSPFIIIGVYNSPDRNSEYTPKQHVDLYGRFLIEELKPWIDQTYRTQKDSAHTGIGGSSLGGLAAMYVVKMHPDVFSQVMLLSPYLRTANDSIVADWVGDGKWLSGKRVFASMGDAPISGNYPGDGKIATADGQQLADALKSAGLQADRDFSYREDAGGSHQEKSWQSEVEPALKWMYSR